MTKKEDFIKVFQGEYGKHPKKVKDGKSLAKLLNDGPSELRVLFREAVEEAAEPAMGMALLFPGTK